MSKHIFSAILAVACVSFMFAEGTITFSKRSNATCHMGRVAFIPVWFHSTQLEDPEHATVTWNRLGIDVAVNEKIKVNLPRYKAKFVKYLGAWALIVKRSAISDAGCYTATVDDGFETKSKIICLYPYENDEDQLRWTSSRNCSSDDECHEYGAVPKCNIARGKCAFRPEDTTDLLNE